MKLSPTLRWTGLALLGLLVAVAVAIAASNLASRQIGLASEPISAGYSLSPASHDERRSQRRHRGARAGSEKRRAGKGVTDPEAASPNESPERYEGEGDGETASPETTLPSKNRQPQTSAPSDRTAEPQTAAPASPEPSAPAQPTTATPTTPPPESSDDGAEPEPDD